MSFAQPSPSIAVSACFAVPPLGADAGARVLLQITPAADFTPNDGRAMDVPAWRMNAQIAQRVIAAFNAAQPPVIDYEHQTLHTQENGQPAPAAGWMHGLRWIEGRGLFAEVELTARARELIAAGEYRYFSPVFEYARAGTPRAGEVLRIVMGALTNHPAITGMQALSLAAAAARIQPSRFTNPEETSPMDLLKKLLAALSLPEDTSEAAALAACTAHKAAADAARAALQLQEGVDAEAITAACTRLQQASAEFATTVAPTAIEPDPAQYVPIAAVRELQANLAALTAMQRARDVDALVAPALADGRLLPAQESWARELGKTNLAALSQYLQTAQPITALTATQTQGQSPAQQDASHGLSADELAVAAACGMTPEVFATGKAA